MHADYIAIISQKNKLIDLLIIIVEINDVNIQSKDIKSILFLAMTNLSDNWHLLCFE